MDDEIERKLRQLLFLSRLIDAPVISMQDWHARRTCEELFCHIDDMLRSDHVRYFYSKRAQRFLYERYRLIVETVSAEDGMRHEVCWTLIDTQANEGQGASVLVAPTSTAKQTPDSPIRLLPILYRVPMRTPEDRARADALCERWNLAAIYRCPSCCQRFSDGEVSEGPYLNRGQIFCTACREEQSDGGFLGTSLSEIQR